MMLLGKTQQVKWIGNSHVIANFIDFSKPFDVLLSSKAIHNELVSTCENHFGSNCSGVDDSRKGFFKIKKPVLDGTTLSVEILNLIGKPTAGSMVNDELSALHISEDFVAAIYGSDKRNVALIVPPTNYEASRPTINDNALMEKQAELLGSDDQALIKFFKEGCCGIAGGYIGHSNSTKSKQRNSLMREGKAA